MQERNVMKGENRTHLFTRRFRKQKRKHKPHTGITSICSCDVYIRVAKRRGTLVSGLTFAPDSISGNT